MNKIISEKVEHNMNVCNEIFPNNATVKIDIASVRLYKTS